MNLINDAAFLAVLLLTVLCAVFWLLGVVADWLAERVIDIPDLYPEKGLDFAPVDLRDARWPPVSNRGKIVGAIISEESDHA